MTAGSLSCLEAVRGLDYRVRRPAISKDRFPPRPDHCHGHWKRRFASTHEVAPLQPAARVRKRRPVTI